MPIENNVTGQQVDGAKLERARQLRREMTPEERMLWQRLRAGRLGGYHFRRQQIIDGFIADFYCHATALVVEVDGAAHFGREGYYSERDSILAAKGLRILRFRNEHVRQCLEEVLRVIQATCDSLALNRANLE
jgi:very-short-patch-repair endonuclease